MKRIIKLFTILLVVLASACAPAYKTTRLQNFTGEYQKGITGDVVKAHVALKPIVLMSFYDGWLATNIPQFRCQVDSIDDTYIYGKLEYIDFTYHISGDMAFEFSELKNANQKDSNEEQPFSPLDILHIYTRFNNLKEGEFKLNINAIYALDVHESGMNEGGKAAIAGGAAITAVAIVLGIIVFATFFAFLSPF